MKAQDTFELFCSLVILRFCLPTWDKLGCVPDGL